MDYKDKYEQAFKKARIWKDKSGMPKDKQGILDDIFPELKESEDEKIRKELVAFVESRLAGFPKCDRFIAWLEKQDKKPQDKSALEAAKEEKVDNQNCIKSYTQEHIGDAIEPKFKVGDWISNGERTTQVVALGTGLYVINREDLSEVSLSMKFVEKWYHLWTIQDAKDGDVLACNEEILLFKSYSVQGRISLYCWYNGQTNNFHSKGVDDTLMTTRNKICPATQEQRDLLFQKMKESGYEWNTEKKELMKIKQKPTDEEMKRLFQTEYEKGKADAVAEMQKSWSEKDEKQLNDIMWIIEAYRKNGFNETHIQIADNSENWLKSLKDRIHPQSRWIPSDEQIEILNMVLTDEAMDDNIANILQELREQLKKLKG